MLNHPIVFIIMFKLNCLCLGLCSLPLVLSPGIRKYYAIIKSITFEQMLLCYGVKQAKSLLFLLQILCPQLFFNSLLQQENEDANWEIFMFLHKDTSNN